MRLASTLPVILSPEEVARFFEHVPGVKYLAVLMLCYGAGLRIGEAIAVKVGDIDSKRMVIRIQQGEGRKDPCVMLSPGLRQVLRSYYRAARPRLRICTWACGWGALTIVVGGVYAFVFRPGKKRSFWAAKS